MTDAAAVVTAHWYDQIAPILYALGFLLSTVPAIIAARQARAAKTATEATKTAVEAVDKKTDAQTATIAKIDEKADVAATAAIEVNQKADAHTLQLEGLGKQAEKIGNQTDGTLGELRTQILSLYQQQIEAHEKHIAELRESQKELQDALSKQSSQAAAPAQTIVVQPVAPVPAAGMPGDRRGPDTTPTAGGRRAQDPKADPPKGTP